MQQSVKFEPVINLQAAKATGLELPPVFSVRADEVINYSAARPRSSRT